MEFMFKHLIKLLLLAILATAVYEITVANCRHSKIQKYEDLPKALKNHLNVTN